jgi:hypothetical protein
MFGSDAVMLSSCSCTMSCQTLTSGEVLSFLPNSIGATDNLSYQRYFAYGGRTPSIVTMIWSIRLVQYCVCVHFQWHCSNAFQSNTTLGDCTVILPCDLGVNGM